MTPGGSVRGRGPASGAGGKLLTAGCPAARPPVFVGTAIRPLGRSDEASSCPGRGTMVQRGPLEQENDNLHLPRLVFTHTRREFGLVRKLIDDINECPQA